MRHFGYCNTFFIKNDHKVKKLKVKMKQWLIAIFHPNSYEIGRLNSNGYHINYIASWSVERVYYRYIEFIKDIKLKTLMNLFKLPNRLTIEPVKIWNRKELLSDDIMTHHTMQELGKKSELLYKKPSTPKSIEPHTQLCSNCMKYRKCEDFLLLKSGRKKKTCRFCSRAK
jgi:hypothetical protein